MGFAVVALCSAIASGAQAVPATLLEDNRSLALHTVDCTDPLWCIPSLVVETPNTPFAQWDVSTIAGSQSSSASSLLLEGSASLTLSNQDPFSYYVDSDYEVVFSLDDFTDITLDGSVWAIDDGTRSSWGSAIVSLASAVDGDLFSTYRNTGSAVLTFEEIGLDSFLVQLTLAPGTYTLYASVVGEGDPATSDPNDGAGFSFTLELSPEVAVPEPGTALLLGTGLLLLARRQ